MKCFSVFLNRQQKLYVKYAVNGWYTLMDKVPFYLSATWKIVPFMKYKRRTNFFPIFLFIFLHKYGHYDKWNSTNGSAARGKGQRHLSAMWIRNVLLFQILLHRVNYLWNLILNRCSAENMPGDGDCGYQANMEK